MYCIEYGLQIPKLLRMVLRDKEQSQGIELNLRLYKDFPVSPAP